MELTQDRVEWWTLVLAVVELWVLLPQHYCYSTNVEMCDS
jgi:hypothetical protein